MKGTVEVFGRELEYDFLAGWIKYNRLQDEISQEALAHGICSVSHLSYFENGKKTLRGDIIEALLKKLGINGIAGLEGIGGIRQKLHNMMLYIEAFDFEIAELLYKELQGMEKLISISPYYIEYKIYQLMYLALVERYNYDALCYDIQILDKIYPSLDKDLQYLYMLVTGKHIYDFRNHGEGIERLDKAYKIKETSWINYRLGVACLLDGEPMKGIYYLERAMDNYEKSGWYNNALRCQNFLGMCYKMLKIYDKAEMHYNAVLKGSDYFNMDKSIWGIYTNFSGLYLSMGRYDESMKWSRMAMETDFKNNQNSKNERGSKAAWQAEEEPMIGACDYIQACVKTGRLEGCGKIFDKFLTEEFRGLRYYRFLYFLYLSIHNFNEEIFYSEVTENILPYYESIGYVNLTKEIKLKLIDHLESKRKYKEANRIYKELTGND